jgi:hypothetical protein
MVHKLERMNCTYFLDKLIFIFIVIVLSTFCQTSLEYRKIDIHSEMLSVTRLIIPSFIVSYHTNIARHRYQIGVFIIEIVHWTPT